MAINQGSILDHIDKPAIHPNDAIVQTLTATSNGKVSVTINGVSVTDFVHAKGLIKADGHASNYLALKDAQGSGESVIVTETGLATPLIVKNQDGTELIKVKPGGSEILTWIWASTSSGSWYLSSDKVSDMSASRVKFQIYDDFHIATLDATNNWFTSAGSDTDATAAATSAGPPEGIAVMGSGDGNAAEDGSVICKRLLSHGSLVSLGGTVFECRVSLDALTGCSQWYGLSDVLGTNAERLPHTVDSGTVADGGLTVTNVAGFSFSTDATATTAFTVTSENAGTIGNSAAEESTGVGPTANTYNVLRIEVDADGTARFYVDGTLKITRSSAVATTALLIPLIGMDSGTDAQSNRDLSIDYILFEGNRPSSNA